MKEKKDNEPNSPKKRKRKSPVRTQAKTAIELLLGKRGNKPRKITGDTLFEELFPDLHSLRLTFCSLAALPKSEEEKKANTPDIPYDELSALTEQCMYMCASDHAHAEADYLIRTAFELLLRNIKRHEKHMHFMAISGYKQIFSDDLVDILLARREKITGEVTDHRAAVVDDSTGEVYLQEWNEKTKNLNKKNTGFRVIAPLYIGATNYIDLIETGCETDANGNLHIPGTGQTMELALRNLELAFCMGTLVRVQQIVKEGDMNNGVENG